MVIAWALSLCESFFMHDTRQLGSLGRAVGTAVAPFGAVLKQVPAAGCQSQCTCTVNGASP